MTGRNSVTPIIATRDLQRLARFYSILTGVAAISRTLDEGPTFYLCLRIGDSELGIVADGFVESAPGPAGVAEPRATCHASAHRPRR